MKILKVACLSLILSFQISDLVFAQSEVDKANAEVNQAYRNYADEKYAEALPIFEKYVNDLLKIFEKRKQYEKIVEILQILILCYEKTGQQAKADDIKSTLAKLQKNDNLSEWGILEQKGYELYQAGKYEQAIPIWEQTKTEAEKRFGKNHEKYTTTLNNLAMLYQAVGNYTTAETLHIEAKNIKEKVLGKEHPDYATSINNLAELYYYMGNYLASETLNIEAKNIVEKVLGKEHPDYATSINNLALLYQTMGNYPATEPLLVEAKNIVEKVLGKEHPHYTTALNNLALLYQTMGNYPAAESLFIEAKNIRLKILGQEHPLYTQSIYNLANLYVDMKNYPKAIVLNIVSKDIYEKVLGKEHPNYANSCSILASLYWLYIGNYPAAEALYIEAKNIREKVLGKEHSDYATSCNNLAGLYSDMGNYPVAEALYIEAKNIREKVLGKEHPDYANSCNNLAGLYRIMGNYPAAEPLYVESVQRKFKNLQTNFAKLSEKEKKQYIDANLLYFENYYFFLTDILQKEPNYKGLINLLQKVFDLQLNTKGLLLAESQKMKKRILGSGNKALLAQFQQWETLKDRIAKGYNLPIAEQAKKGYNVPSLEKAANNLEKQLAASSEEFKEAFIPPIYTYLDLQLKLREEEAAIEMIRTRFGRTISVFDYIGKGIRFDTLGEKGNMRITQILSTKSKVGKLGLKANDQILKIDGKATNKQNTKELQTLLAKPACSVEVLRADGKTKQKFMLYNDSIFVEKQVIDTAYLALVLTKKDLFPILLKNGADLETNTLAKYKESIEKQSDNSFAYTAYWLEIAKKLQGINKVYFSADGVYHLVNLNTLQNPDNKKYVIDEIELHQVSNLKDLVSTKNAKNRTSKNNVIEMVGFPNYQLSAEARKKLIQQKKIKSQNIQSNYISILRPNANRAGVNDLPATKTEIQSIGKFMQAKQWKTNVYFREQALEEVVNVMKNPKVLHIATHGYFLNTEEIPKENISKVENIDLSRNAGIGKEGKSFEPMLRSGLILAGGAETLKLRAEGKPVSTEVEDGILTAYEAMSLDLDETDLVVLSACETGLGDIQNGEGVYGLQRAFQVAGAKSVIISLWKVADEATQELMTTFYQLWTSGKYSTREAFKEAQKQLRAEYPHPYYWGAFVLVGE